MHKNVRVGEVGELTHLADVIHLLDPGPAESPENNDILEDLSAWHIEVGEKPLGGGKTPW